MSKQEFLEALRAALAQMPAEEREKQIAYYDELIADMCEDGMSETEAVAHLGDPRAIAEELLTALPLGTLIKTSMKPKKDWSPLAIVLIVLGFPVWFPLIVSFFAIVLSVLLPMAGVVCSL